MLTSPAAFDNPKSTILLVEDEPFVREVTKRLLEGSGYAVVTARDGVEAVEVYEQSSRPIDVVMTDLVLPGRTGPELADDLRRRSPQLRVLVTSGYSAEDSIEDPTRSTYFLAKPYSRAELVEKIEGILNRPMPRAATQAS